MTKLKVPCPRCGQDWLDRVKIVHLGCDAILCGECDALWTQQENVSFTNFVDYNGFMVRNGRINPQMHGEIEVLGPLEVETSRPIGTEKLLCPSCHRGRISFIRIMKHEFHFFYVCDTCASSWANIDAVGTSDVMELSERVRPFGLKGLKSEFDELPYPISDGA